MGEQFASQEAARLQALAHRRLRRTIGVTEDPPPPCSDPELAFFEPGSITRQIHGDLPSMLIGGLASLLFQMLHPLAMAGVSEHSRFRDDPLGRLERTARFVGITTYGSTDEATAAIRVVRKIHQRVTGTGPDGIPYSANDPDLLLWVHAVEVRSFLSASIAYGPEPLSAREQDRYVDQMARVGLGLGVIDPPRTVEELDRYLEEIRPELAFTEAARDARNFVLRGVRRWPHQMAVYGVLVAAAQGVLPAWARRDLGLVAFPASDRLSVRPAASLLCSALRWVAPPPTQTTMESPPSTATI